MSTHNRIYYEKNHHCRFDYFELLNSSYRYLVQTTHLDLMVQMTWRPFLESIILSHLIFGTGVPKSLTFEKADINRFCWHRWEFCKLNSG